MNNNCNTSGSYNETKFEYTKIMTVKSDLPSMPITNRKKTTFFLIAITWSFVLFYLAKNFAVGHFWFVLLSVLLLSTPIAICGIYIGTVKKIRTAAGFLKKGWIHKIFTARLLMIPFILGWAHVTSCFMLIQLHTYSTIEWVSFFIVIPVFFFIFNFCKRYISKEVKPYLITYWAVIFSSIVTPVIMLFIYFFVIKYFGDIPEYTSLQDAIDAQKDFVADMTGSAIIYEFSQCLASYNGFKIYYISHLGAMDKLWSFLLFSLGGYIVFLNACTMLSCFLIPSTEYHRILGAPADTDDPQPTKRSNIFIVSLILTFYIIFIFIPFFAKIETWFQQRPIIGESRQNVEDIVVKKFDKINDFFYREGTVAQIKAAELEALKKVDVSLVALGKQVDLAFSRLEVNVDEYLDWYYSLLGEYSRIASMMVGELEPYMVSQFEKKVFEENSFIEVQDSIERAILTHKEAKEEYERIAEGIMKENQRNPPTDETSYEVVQQVSLNNLLSSSNHDDFIAIQKRLTISGGVGAVAGGVTSVVAGKIIAKMVSEGTFKIAATAITKVLVSKAAASTGGAATGAVIGGFIGSVIPGPGTAAGAVIGGSVGAVVIGVSVDKLILELEEHLSRDEFKVEILSAISEARAEFKKGLQL